MTAKKTTKTARVSASTSAAGAPSAVSSTIAASSPPPAAHLVIDAATPISPATIAQCLALIGQIEALIGPVKPLRAVDIRHALKLRKGGAQVIGQVIDLCNHHGISTVGPVTVQGLSAQAARADALNQIGVPLGAVQKKLADATFSAESGSWQSATALYTTLQRLSLVDPTILAGLQPVEDFFKTKKNVGMKRANQATSKANSADTRAAKYARHSPETPAPPAANGNAAPAAATPSGTTAPAPAAPVATVAPVTSAAPGTAARS